MVVKVQVKVFSVVILCSVAVGYRCFGGLCCLHLQDEANGAVKGTYSVPTSMPPSQRHSLHPEEVGSRVLRNVGILP